MDRNNKIIVGSAITLLLLALFAKRKKIKSMAQDVWDSLSNSRINTLHPLVRDRAVKFLNEAERQGIKLRIVSALRTFDEQTKLYNQGRTTPGKIVTNAKAGQSSHNFGTAIDVVPIENGVAAWNSKNWKKIADIGKSVGFSWGGDWKGFKDMPHFEFNNGKSLVQLLALYNSGKVKDGYVNLT